MSRRVTKKKTGPPMVREHWERASQFWSWIFDATDRAVTAWINRPRIGDTRPGSSVVSFKPREHFRSDGKAKVTRTRSEAVTLCKENPDFRAYQCSVCQGWHIGHKPSKRLAS